MKKEIKKIIYLMPISKKYKEKIFYFSKKIILLKRDIKNNINFSNKKLLKKHLNNIFNNYSKQSKDYVDLIIHKKTGKSNILKYITFYLPQFHPIAENDEWWGKGFTEWNNVGRAVPQFIGHYQPHLPGELGYYDLRMKDTMEKQIKLAKNYNIYGFCMYYYWFDGKQLLEKPLEILLENKDIDIPFCLCWANENWSRRWDGMDAEILIKQNYGKNFTNLLINDIKKYFDDSRYIRINNKPVFLIYRPNIIPNVMKAIGEIREYAKNNKIGDLYLVGVMSKEEFNPNDLGLDALVEFPPNSHSSNLKLINNKIKIMNPEFNGLVMDYKQLMNAHCSPVNADYPIYKTVAPSWDNTARRNNSGTIYYGSSPKLYEEWLYKASMQTIENSKLDDKIVFINAWNEWAEGAHLEPDKMYGYAFLEKTHKVLEKIENEPSLMKEYE